MTLKIDNAIEISMPYYSYAKNIYFIFMSVIQHTHLLFYL